MAGITEKKLKGYISTAVTFGKRKKKLQCSKVLLK